MSFPSLFGVEDKVAFVTGAGGGLGTEFAQIMAEAGADVVCTDLDEAAAQATAKRVDGLGRRGLALRCDVTDEESVREAFAAGRREFGHATPTGS
jgi:NAD(P)-dependent dehydrogenase (short-subunit alcohol dehydrogenase family)